MDSHKTNLGHDSKPAGQESAGAADQASADGMDKTSSSDHVVALLALEEYKIIQEKIDKIGDFCLKVKSWSLTITAGILAGTATSKVPWWYSLAALATTWLFQICDDYQRRLQIILTSRALALERYFRASQKDNAILRKLFPGTLGAIPYLANSIRNRSDQERRSRFMWRRGTRSMRHLLQHNRAWCVWRADRFFYSGQYLFIVLAATAFLYKGCTAEKTGVKVDQTALSTGYTKQSSQVDAYVFRPTYPLDLDGKINLSNLPDMSLTLQTNSRTDEPLLKPLKSKIDSPNSDRTRKPGPVQAD